MFATIQSSPIEPHIPEDPTDAEVLALLGWLDFGTCYYQKGDPTALAQHMPPGGQAFKLEPVMGVHWRSGRDLTTTLYIDGKPYTFSSAWIYANLDRQKKAEVASSLNRMGEALSAYVRSFVGENAVVENSPGAAISRLLTGELNLVPVKPE